MRGFCFAPFSQTLRAAVSESLAITAVTVELGLPLTLSVWLLTFA